VGEVTRNTRIASKLLKRAAHIVEINDGLDEVTEQAVEKAMQMLVIPDISARSV
jgi:Holliday junction resolvasome RuvABC ATP-dependent DNA helicase subunit